MQARVVGAARGARWLGEGWRLFRAAPLGWLAAVFGYWLLMTLVSLVPFVGVAAAAVLVPAFSVGFMAIARATGHNAPAEMGLLFEGFRHEARSQIALGIAYLGCLAALLAASALADDGALARWMLSGRRPPDDVLQSEEFFTALLVAAALYLPVMCAFWFAPPLAAWHSTGPAKALFFSLAASVMNWRAFLAYGAATAVITLVLPFAILTGLTLASAGALKFPVTSLVFPLILILLPTLFASFYASYRDVFGYDAAP
ncbi:MAG TPA: BPSS1780 family membrane protein [Burkholderiales bacterium]|nr:BPSS1780 family membrane protein [Burkholderiales bacterium]